MNTDYPILSFPNAAAWRTWLDTNHATSNGIWLRIYKKASATDTVTYAEALDHALCYGWIDGQKKSHDDRSFLQKFTPRRARSIWSKRNIEHIARLADVGLLMPAGLAEAERAKADGRWDAAYDAPTTMPIPEDFLAAVRKSEKASAFFDTLPKSRLFAIGFQLQTAKKAETRERRFARLLDMLEQGERP